MLTRSELIRVLTLSTLPPSATMDEIGHLLNKALIKASKGSIHSPDTDQIKAVVDCSTELIKLIRNKDWAMVEAKTMTITKGLYPVTDRIVAQARMLVKANHAGLALLRSLEDGAKYALRPYSDHLDLSITAEQVSVCAFSVPVGCGSMYVVEHDPQNLRLLRAGSDGCIERGCHTRRTFQPRAY